MIAVTCRNGEHFSVDPVHIERVGLPQYLAAQISTETP